MTVHVIVTIRDLVADSYGPPTPFINRAVAERAFVTEIRSGNPQSSLCTNPQDFRLVEIGSFDDQTGQFTLLSEPETIINGEYVARQP